MSGYHSRAVFDRRVVVRPEAVAPGRERGPPK